MTVENYVKQIVKNVHCNKNRRLDIQKQLLADIEERLSAGETAEDVIKDMGDAREIADSFNDNLSETEKKRYRLRKVLLITGCIILGLLLVAFGILWMLPKTIDIETSAIFSKTEVESKLTEVIGLLDEGDYAALQTMATDQMALALQEDHMEEAKAQFCEDFGARTGFGAIYSSEVIQRNQHFAICQVNVSYENISITYTITFDEDMKLAGLYMK